MRVLQAMAGAAVGGAEAFFSRLVPALGRAGLEQRVVIRRNADRARGLRAADLDVVELPFGGAIDIYTPIQLKRQIANFRPDVVLSWMNRASAMCPRGEFVHVGRLGGYYDLKYYASCDHLIGNTEDIVAHLGEEGWPGDRVHYLPNFVNGAHEAPWPRAKAFTPDRSPLILALGRLHANKAFDVLLRAMARVPEAYLWIAGEGPLRGELLALAERLGVKPRLRILGWRDDVASLYAAADIVVCPSRFEPLGNVVIEAWAQSLPIIAADSAGPGALIEHMETGVLVPVDDHVAMARAIKILLTERSLRERVAGAGFAVYSERFTESVVIERYMRFFAQISR
ncbi:MAG TPA: glycosyltransferase [Rhodospirillales bacterium]|nr:glycosyltransferase [Rhodospirillales bacterium]